MKNGRRAPLPRRVKLAEVAQAVGQALHAQGVAIVSVHSGAPADGSFAHHPACNPAEMLELIAGLRRLADDMQARLGVRPACEHPRLRWHPLANANVCPDCDAVVGGPPASPAKGSRWRQLDASDVWTVLDVRRDSQGAFLVKLELPAGEDELEPTQREVHSDRFAIEWVPA